MNAATHCDSCACDQWQLQIHHVRLSASYFFRVFHISKFAQSIQRQRCDTSEIHTAYQNNPMSSNSDLSLLSDGGFPTNPKRESVTDRARKEIDGAVSQMRTNITKVGERGERLDALQDKTDNLATQANGFRRGANRVRKQMWWKDMKMRMCIIVGIIVLLIVIIVPSGKSTDTE